MLHKPGEIKRSPTRNSYTTSRARRLLVSKQQTTDLFVSYASEDFDNCVSDIFMALFESGITSTWIDRLAIKPGESIPDRIDEGLAKTRYLVPIVTKTYFKKMWTRSELDAVRMLAKPAIPIWIDVDVKCVKNFSPILAAQKAIIYQSNPYEVAEQIGNVLLRNKRSHFFKTSESREEAVLFWQLVYLYVLTIIRGNDPDKDEGLNELNKMPTNNDTTIQEHVRETIKMTPDEMNARADAFRKRARELGNEVRDEDISHLICGEIKRQQKWFPHEPREHHALKLIGIDRF
ncbi:MAG: toll/interleukin-1 receptor domain-containing protein [Planctomycetota bacterium]|nr:toll/interleukin-1 receptor domain-containing protein [Planctomycetota bacterium]